MARMDMTSEFARTLGIEVCESSDNSVTICMPVAGKLQPYGVLHGGANAVLVEHAASLLAARHCPEGRIPVGSEVTTQHLRPVYSGSLRATAHILALSSVGATIEVDVYNDDARRSATGTLTVVFIDEARFIQHPPAE